MVSKNQGGLEWLGAVLLPTLTDSSLYPFLNRPFTHWLQHQCLCTENTAAKPVWHHTHKHLFIVVLSQPIRIKLYIYLCIENYSFKHIFKFPMFSLFKCYFANEANSIFCGKQRLMAPEKKVFTLILFKYLLVNKQN